MLLASHNMGEVERMCDDVIMLREGLVVDQGSPQELIARYGRENMEEVFLDVARGRGEEPLAESAGTGDRGVTHGFGVRTRRDVLSRSRGSPLPRAACARWCAGTRTCCSSRGRAWCRWPTTRRSR